MPGVPDGTCQDVTGPQALQGHRLDGATGVTSTDVLIGKALARAPGGPLRARSIQLVDGHLVGHAFKYAEKSANVLGVYPYHIDYTAPDGTDHGVDVMVKAKPSEDEIIRVYGGLLAKGGIALNGDLRPSLAGSDYSTPNLKEAILFDRFADDLKPYLPPSLGVYMDPAASYTLRLEEKLPAGSVILDPDDDTTAAWQPSFSATTLRAIAAIHGRFHDRYRALVETGYFWVCERQTMTQARALWYGLLTFLDRAYPDLLDQGRLSRHRRVLETLDEWYARVDTQPKTLLYGDVNPQNLAFAKTADGYELSVFDWERAVISLPQRDLCEHLIYTLRSDFAEDEALAMIALYRAELARHSAVTLDDEAFFDGLVWMLYDLMLNRLPLMILVKHVAGKRRHADQAYLKAHRLLACLER